MKKKSREVKLCCTVGFWSLLKRKHEESSQVHQTCKKSCVSVSLGCYLSLTVCCPVAQGAVHCSPGQLVTEGYIMLLLYDSAP